MTDWRKSTGMQQYKIKINELAELGVRKIYFKEYKIFFVIDESTKTVYVIRILHMLVDSKAWLYRTFGIVE